MLIKVSQKAEKQKVLDRARGQPGFWEGTPKPQQITEEQVHAAYRAGYRKHDKFKPGRVSNPYRNNYDNIKWE